MLCLLSFYFVIFGKRYAIWIQYIFRDLVCCPTQGMQNCKS
jgi:hypothetical protein